MKLYLKITPNEAQIKHQSVNKAKKITNINYIYKNNSNNYSKYLKKSITKKITPVALME